MTQHRPLPPEHNAAPPAMFDASLIIAVLAVAAWASEHFAGLIA